MKCYGVDLPTLLSCLHQLQRCDFSRLEALYRCHGRQLPEGLLLLLLPSHSAARGGNGQVLVINLGDLRGVDCRNMDEISSFLTLDHCWINFVCGSFKSCCRCVSLQCTGVGLVTVVPVCVAQGYPLNPAPKFDRVCFTHKKASATDVQAKTVPLVTLGTPRRCTCTCGFSKLRHCSRPGANHQTQPEDTEIQSDAAACLLTPAASSLPS